MAACHECGNQRDADSQFCPWCFALPGPDQHAVAAPVPAESAVRITVPATPAGPSAATYTPEPERPSAYIPEWTPPPTPPSTPVPPAFATAPARPAEPFDLFAAKPARRRGSDRTPLLLVAAALAVVLVVTALVLNRGEPEATVDTAGASLPMATDEQIKAAMADVAAAQRAHFDKANTFTASLASLRAARSKAPLAVGPGAEKAGLVYVDLELGSSKVKTVFYLSARSTNGECLYLKGEYTSTYEATHAGCEIALAVDYGVSNEQRKLDEGLVRSEDLGAGWTTEPVTHEESAGWEPETAACLGITPAMPLLTTGTAAFTQGNTELGAQVSRWSTAELAQQDLGVIDHPKLGSCFVAELKQFATPEAMPGVRRFTVTLSNRGEFPGIPEAKRARFRLMAEGDYVTASVWIDYVVAVRDRVRVHVMNVVFERTPDDAVTAKAMNAMLARVD